METRSILFVDDKMACDVLGRVVKATILIVDDSEANRKMHQRMLEKEDYKVYLAGDGKQCLELARKNNPDLILLDIVMPVMTGYEVLEALKADPNLASIPVLMLSAKTDCVDVVKALEMGAQDYLRKPFNSDELVARVDTLATIKQTQDKRKQAEEALQKAHREKTKEMENQLAQSDKLASLGRVAAGVAHEINNPATFVNVNAITMEKWWKLFEPIFDKAVESGWDREPGLKKLSDMRSRFPKMIQSIRDGATRISSITTALREFARPDHEEKQLVDLRDILENAVIMTKNQYKYHADLVIENGTEIPKIFGSSQKLEQVFINLIINATDATKEKADIMRDRGQSFQGLISIIISLRETPEETIEIVVKDNGIGMGPDVVKKIFDPFFTTKPQNKGTGLGMSIVYGIIQNHGGGISVESTKGEKTAFTITLPVEQTVNSEQ